KDYQAALDFIADFVSLVKELEPKGQPSPEEAQNGQKALQGALQKALDGKQALGTAILNLIENADYARGELASRDDIKTRVLKVVNNAGGAVANTQTLKDRINGIKNVGPSSLQQIRNILIEELGA